jgi:hypothetical protein
LSDEIEEQDPEPPGAAEDGITAAGIGSGKRLRRPWRWALGAVSIAALGAGIFFISKKGAIRRPESETPGEEP